MNKQEFLDALAAKLSEEIPNPAEVADQVSYYEGYIDSEIADGKDEETVTDQLGDPILIARNILEAPGSDRRDYSTSSYEQGKAEARYQRESESAGSFWEAAYESADRGLDTDFGEVPEEEMPKEDPFAGMDGGFFERTGPQEVNGGTGESGSAEKTEQSIEDNRNAAAGFFRMADGSFNWGCLGWILVAVLVVLAVVTLVTHVVIRFWPVILLLLSAGIITSFFNNRR